MRLFTDVKVFSVSTYGARLELSDRINEWLAQNRDIEIVDKEVLQSSDSSFHCYTLTLFFVRTKPAGEGATESGAAASVDAPASES